MNPAIHPEEKAFQDALDADPSDWTTRLVFADWLEERGDPRAVGYRALGVLKLQPYLIERTWAYSSGNTPSWYDRVLPCNVLPADWFNADSPGNEYWTFDFFLRYESEDRAALAFSVLPPERQIVLLNPKPKGRVARGKAGKTDR